MPAPETTLFEDAIDVPLWLEADRDTPYAERARRDRGIAKDLADRDAIGQVRGWWRSLRANEAGLAKAGVADAGAAEARAAEAGAADAHAADARAAKAGPGARLDRLRALVVIVMIALGALAGISLALAAFRYDGSQPVNVVWLLALLVGLQLLLLLLTLVLLIPRRVPGLRGVQELLAALNPGAWAASVLARFARTGPSVFDLRGRVGAAGFAKWQVLVWSQVAAVAFNVAALGTAVALVTFTDLAFGWSTTLTVDPAHVTRVARAIAWPWHAIVPRAVPDADLVAQSQFFRLDAGGARTTAAVDSRVLAGWWPFTLCAIVVYGLLPRLALLVLAAIRLRSATRRLLLDDPRVVQLSDRMRSPTLETEADRHDELPGSSQAPARGLDHALGGAADAIVWEASISADGARLEARRRFGAAVENVLEAGGARGLQADRKTLESLRQRGDRALLVFTPAWEPPVLELLDFLKAARTRVGDDASIVVVPLPDRQRAVTPVELETWERGVGRLKDARLYVEAGSQ